MSKLSVCLIVKNEEAMLARCLESVKEADEIIIVDTGSTDETVNIAKKYTDHVYTDYRWKDHFAEARNHSLSKATGDWVLSIDADEVLEEGGIEKIRKLVEGSTSNTFSVKMKGGANTHFLPRIFKRETCQWKGRAHESLTPVERNHTDIQIEYGYSPAHKNDPDRMLRILTKAVDENPTSARDHYYLAREFFYRKKHEKALEHFSECIKYSRWSPEKSDAYLYKARCLFTLGRGEEARESCLRAIQQNPDFKEALSFMAELHYSPHKEKWQKMADVAENKDVLFVRALPKKEILPLDMSQVDIAYFKNMLLRYEKPRVLEWGSGNSTKYFTDFLISQNKSYEWTSVEHHEGWFNTVKGWGLKDVNMVYAEKGSDAYFDQKGQYDVIFIDGRNRRKCLEKAKELLAPKGVVMIHDADREYYHSAMEGYCGKFVCPEKGTLPRLWIGSFSPLETRIPKIIHQIWIGPKQPPAEMEEWRLPGWYYMLWDEKAIDSLGLKNKVIYDQYIADGKFSGAANVARAEILERFGGVYIDADSKMKHTLDGAPFLDWDLFTAFEADNFYVDGMQLVANGIIGCTPHNQVLKDYVEALSKIEELHPSWRKTGPLLWTKFAPKHSALPAYTFLPVHHSGKVNKVEGTIYCSQFWGTTKNLYLS